MPIYEYECTTHGNFEALRPLAEYRLPQHCPHCKKLAARVLITAVSVGTLATTTRQAHERNERSAHSPRSSKELRHGSGCSCCNGKQAKPATTHGVAKSFPTKRPWMISH